MTVTAPFVHVPVDQLEIVMSAGYTVFAPYREASYDNAGIITFNLRTAASSTILQRRLKVWDVQVVSPDEYLDYFRNEQVEGQQVTFYCKFGGHTFFGVYDLRTRKGILKADTFREESSGT